MASRPVVLREIERKFTCTRSLLPTLLRHPGTPPFASLTPIKHTTFTDAYFDTPSRTLSKHHFTPIWLRKRNDNWQAKITRFADCTYKRASYDELDSISEIKRLLLTRITPDSLAGPELNWGLQSFCTITTDRLEFKADGMYTVVLDHTDFGHEVGEVERMVEIGAGIGEEEAALAEMDRWMQRYQWFFGSGPQVPPKGKMTAYFERFGGW